MGWEDCVGKGWRSKGSTPAVVRYSAGTADSVRSPDRVITGPHTLLCEPSAIAVGPRGETYVLNHIRRNWSKPSEPPGDGWTTWVTVYDSAARGDAAPIRALGIAPMSGSGAGGIAVDRGGYLYLTSELGKSLDEGSVAVFEAGADGNVSPMRVLSGSRTGLQRPRALTVDRHGNLYVVNSQEKDGDKAVRVFTASSEGNVVPCRVIAGPKTGLDQPAALTVDRRDRLYVANAGRFPESNRILIFDAGARGDRSPLRTLTALEISDRMYRPRRAALDSRDSLYVSSERNLSVFGPSQADSARPSRTFFRGAPRLFALDRHDTLYALSGDEIKVYPPGYTGIQPEVRTIAGARTGIDGTKDIAVDSRGSLYLMADTAIRVFAPGATGDVAPSRTIAGDRTGLREASGLALDRADRLYVSNGPQPSGEGGGSGGAIRVYAPGASGEDEPVRLVAGRATGLSRPIDIEFDSRGFMYVSDERFEEPGYVSVFRPQATGNEPPVRRIAGPTTLLRRPIALAFGAGDTLYALNFWGYYGACHGRPGQVNATVTAFAPGTEGDVEPARYVVLIKNGKRLIPDLPRGIAADASGAVQVWHRQGAVTYAPGASGFVPPSRGFAEPRDEGTAAGAVAATRDGKSYQTNSPGIDLMICT